MTITDPDRKTRRNWLEPLIVSLLLIAILLGAAYFRFSGLDWGEYQYLHPDERFLLLVGSDISPVQSLGEYFDTVQSSLNPNNRGHGFYVYGTLPMFLARYAAQAVFGGSGTQAMTDVGRVLSACADLLTVLLVFLSASRLYDRRVGVLAAAFSAVTVLQIQQAHYFTMDSFLTMFSFLAFYLAVLVLKASPGRLRWEPEPGSSITSDPGSGDQVPQPGPDRLSAFIRHPLFATSLGFGVALGMAVASKLNAAAVAVTLPIALALYLIKLPSEQRERRVTHLLLYLVLAALVSLLAFRLFQPYAFSGPGFFGLKPNPQWVNNIREQRLQSTGDVDFPPAMQWARRSIAFSWQNMVTWGFGLPLGLLVWAGFLWAGWRLLSKWNRRDAEWYSHALVWVWTALYFAWQSLQLNPTMRYQLPIYPTLTILGAWAVVALYDCGKARLEDRDLAVSGSGRQNGGWLKVIAIAGGGLVLLLTTAYAYAFTQIYLRPITRVAASRWILQNVAGPITLPIRTTSGVRNQLLPVPYEAVIQPQLPFSTNFEPLAAGSFSEVVLPRLLDENADGQSRTLKVDLNLVPPQETPLASGMLSADLQPTANGVGREFVVELDQAIQLDPERTYNLSISLLSDDLPYAFDPQASLQIEPDTGAAPVSLSVSLETSTPRSGSPLKTSFRAELDGALSAVTLRPLVASQGGQAPTPRGISLQAEDPEAQPLYSPLSSSAQPADQGYRIELFEPLPLVSGELYTLSLSMEPGGGMVRLSGVGLANEGEWDDGLPLRLDGYDAFGGIYPLDLNFNMYWDDNLEKLERFLRILDQADYVVISSNRQWGTLPRIPERFPLTSLYYRSLIGCPDSQTVETCYRVASPGTYRGELGYELVETFTSEPQLGPIRLNDQFAEEAFTVYDHPKVLIFKKTADYDPERVRAILSEVDFSKIIRKPPLRYSDHPEDLMLPADRWAEQQRGGTWSELFGLQSALNRYPALAALVWYLSVALLGLLFYPILRLALPALSDRGYPLARIAGMLALAYLVWLAGSLRLPFTRPTISLAIGALLALSAVLAFKQRLELKAEWGRRRRYFLVVEALALAFFLAFLLIRFGNPDLWHPWKGGEKPMDFSYFNAVLKSTTFPPYDPWFAGGYLNYYYFGFVVVGVLVKWLGIEPSIAYNLILPTLFSLIALGAFSLAWNLSRRARPARLAPAGPEDAVETDEVAGAAGFAETASFASSGSLSSYITAIAASLGMAVLGNLGIVKMIYQGYQRLAAPGGILEGANLLRRLGWAFLGFVKTLQGDTLPYGIGDWYWNPSRIIPAPGDVEPITEFPFFTLLYADLHAHLIALSITLLILTFLVGVVLGRATWKRPLGALAWFLLAALAIGSLRPTNTWDLPPYLMFGIAAVGYAFWSRPTPQGASRSPEWWAAIPAQLRRLLTSLGAAILLVGLAFLLFAPYAHWYTLGYTKIDLWNGTHTPLSAYLNHWALFLAVILPWMAWETRDWLAKTPFSALRRLSPYRFVIQFFVLLVLLAALLLVFWREVTIAWFVLPLAAWAGVLILRPGQPDAKRMVLFLVGSGLLLTLMVEVIVLRGDIGRMNTVFKFYLQVWTMFAISAACALGWLWPALADWRSGWRFAWQLAFFAILAGASLYPMMATMAKIEDRMAGEAPPSLDGMSYMEYASYTDTWGAMDLGQDYRAIRWLQENALGSPVIVEANLRDLYRWGSRFSIYTGLPGVVGWEWHQQQQRTSLPGSWVSERIFEVDNFYLTDNWEEAAAFLQKYDVRYVILGQQERGHYPGPGLEKFELANGVLWQEVYREGETVIYEVSEAAP